MRYEIQIDAGLDKNWSQWFEGMDVEWVADGRTRLIGDIEDQSALHGILTQIRDLGLELVSVARTDHNPKPIQNPKETS